MTKMNRIIRDRHLTPEEVAKYKMIREQVAEDRPETEATIRKRVQEMNQEEANAIPPLRDGWESVLTAGVTYRMKLKDAFDDKSTLDLKLEVSPSDRLLVIGAEGYGEMTANPGEGHPILVEYHEGKLRVLIWADINQEDPTDIIDLSGALESNREDE